MPLPLFEFGEFRLDRGSFELVRNGRAVRLERKPMELLILLVERNGQLVTREEIAERLWNGEVFVDTEHGINTAVRKIRSALGDDSETGRYIQTVTGKGYRFTSAVIQVPPAPNVQKSESASPMLAPLPHPLRSSPFRRRAAVWYILTSCALVGALVAGWFVLRNRNAANPIHSLAVLPLDNLTGDPNQNYFSDGMTDELITMLARDSTLRITSRTSVMQYKGAHRPLPEIARALHVDGIVEGSVERSGKHVQMTLQLIRGDTDTHIWAQRYDRDVADVAALPDEAAREIAKRLNSSVTTAVPTKQIDPAAHDAYLHGRYMWFSDNFSQCIAYMQKAIQLQPDYAAAWSGLADAYAGAAVVGSLPPADAFRESEAASRQALQIDDSLPEAHHSLAAFYLFSAWDWHRAEEESDRAISLNPNVAEFYHLHSYILMVQNRDQEALREQILSTQMAPFERPWALGAAYTFMGNYDAAVHEMELRSSAERPNYWLQVWLAKAYWFKGKKKEWADHMEQSFLVVGDEASAQAFRRAFSSGGAQGAAEWLLDRDLRNARTGYVSPMNLAFDYALLARKQDTLRELDVACQERAPWLVFLQKEPAFNFLHADPRYRLLVQRIGLPPAY